MLATLSSRPCSAFPCIFAFAPLHLMLFLRYFDISFLLYLLYERVGCPAWAQKGSLLYILSSSFTALRSDVLVTLCLQTVMALHPMHPILISGGSEGAIFYWNLSSPIAWTTPNFPTALS